MSALSLAIYSMFVAIVVPEAKNSKAILFVVILAAFLSCLFYYVPFLKNVSSGLSITICSIIAASIVALLFPIDLEDENDEITGDLPNQI